MSTNLDNPPDLPTEPSALTTAPIDSPLDEEPPIPLEDAPRLGMTVYFRLLKQSWHYAGSSRWLIPIYFSLYVPAVGMTLLQPYAFGQALNALQLHHKNYLNDVMLWLGVFTGSIAVMWLFHGPGRVMERHVGFKVWENFTNTAYRKLSELPLTWHQGRHSGDLINRINTAAGSLRSFTEDQFVYIQITLRLVGTIAIMTWIEPVIGVLTAVTLGACLWGMVWFDRRLAKYNHEGNELGHRFAATFYDFVSNMTTLKILRLGRLSQGSVARALSRTYPSFAAAVKINEWKWFFFQMATTLMQSVMIVGYIFWQLKAKQSVAIGTLSALVRYQQDLGGVISAMAGNVNNLMRCGQGVAAVDQLFAEHDAIVESMDNLPQLDNWQTLTVQHLAYQHAPRPGEKAEAQPAGVTDFSATFKRGEKIALIGVSGGGKSTLLGMLRGIFPPAAGGLSIDAQDLPLGALNRLTTMIPQDPELFENTAKFNITLGLPAEPEALDTAIRLSAFDTVLGRMKQGLATRIVEKGANMSGGQKQRLALARGIYAARNSSIVLLDEPTSSLDLETERRVFTGLFAEWHDKTVVATIHRLHLLPLFDRIIFMAAGTAIADGPAAQLLRDPGPVRDLFRSNESRDEPES